MVQLLDGYRGNKPVAEYIRRQQGFQGVVNWGQSRGGGVRIQPRTAEPAAASTSVGSSGGRPRVISVPPLQPGENPFAAMAGSLQGHPLADAYAEAIESYRRQVDATEAGS